MLKFLNTLCPSLTWTVSSIENALSIDIGLIEMIAEQVTRLQETQLFYAA